MSAVVSIKNFSLVINGKKIVRDLSFDVHEGEVFAFLGANGSGKTSTIRTLLGIYKATEGELLIDGQVYSPAMAATVGYLPEERGLYVRDKVLDTMIYFGELKGMSRMQAQQFSLEYLKRVEMSDYAKVTIKKLSSGQQQKIQLGVAIMGQPKLLILDEPTKGLDPVNRKHLIDIVTEQRERGVAVIYITHLMEEVERLADRLIIIKEGASRAYGTVDEVKRQWNVKTIEEVFIATYDEKTNE
jgi:ABC-2 type transport system ATP-binding protein